MSYPPPCVTVHILHDNTLTQDNRDKFIYIAGRYGQIIKFYNVEKICANEIESIKEFFVNHHRIKQFTYSTFFRLFTPKIFLDDIERVIYLDSDIIVNLDINEFWQVDIGDKALAAVSEKDMGRESDLTANLMYKDGYVKLENYFNILDNFKLSDKQKKQIETANAFYEVIAEDYGIEKQNTCSGKSLVKKMPGLKIKKDVKTVDYL